MKMIMIIIAVLAVFVRPTWELSPTGNDISEQQSLATSNDVLNIVARSEPETYNATNGEQFPWNDARLPKEFIPKVYSIFIHANLTNKNVTSFRGSINMTLIAQNRTNFIIFHAKNLNISNLKAFTLRNVHTIAIGVASLEAIGIQKTLKCLELDQFYIKFSSSVNKDMTVQLQMDFIGNFQDGDMTGLYRSSYTTKRGEKRVLACTHFQPCSARTVFPCLDEPEWKAQVIMSIVREPKYFTLSNTLIERTYPYQQGLLVDVYQPTVSMSTYLIALAISDYKNISATTTNGTMVRVFAPEDQIHMGEFALNTSVALLDYFSNFFKLPYSLPKLDMISIPNLFTGAMENWGLMTFRDIYLLYDPRVTTATDKVYIASVVGHEVAHQWFGNLVTPKWWDDIWLNEGFACFLETQFGTDFVDKKLRRTVSRLKEYFHVMGKDSLKSSHPIQSSASDVNSIFAMFDEITYYKGSAVAKMLHSFITDLPFKTSMQQFVDKYKFKNANSQDLWDVFEKNANLPPNLTVSMIMNTWIKQMGFPVVNVTVNNGTLYLSQTRFLQNKDSNATEDPKYSNNPYGYKWIIPFVYKTSLKPKVRYLVWLKDSQIEIKLNDSSFTWLKANYYTQGFYRVNYDKEGWKKITRQLSVDYKRFSIVDKIGLIEDVFSLASAGLTDYTTALNMTRYMVNETDYFVWYAALKHIRLLRNHLYAEEEYDQINDYLLKLLKVRIDAVSWDKLQNPVDEFMPELLIEEATNLEYKKVVDKAVDLFQQLKRGINLTISNSLRFTVYSQGVKYGNKSDWDFVHQMYTKELVPTERESLLKALTYTRDTRIIQLLLKYGCDETKIDVQDYGLLLMFIANRPTGHPFVWIYLRENYDKIFEKYGATFAMTNILNAILEPMLSQFYLKEVMSFSSKTIWVQSRQC